MAKILIADDDIEIQELLTFTLENEEHKVIVASDGEEALNKAIKEKPDLVILDIAMPRLSGYEVCEKLRKNPVTTLIPIIILTSLTHVKDRITGIKLGADEYICKPFEPYELVARVEGLLRRVKADLSANPLTGLPGSVSVEKEIKDRLTVGESFAVFYIDIDNFKPFNDKYGFEKGDELIKTLSTVIQQSLTEVNETKGFIGHISGEDFILVVSPKNMDNLSKKIIELFDSKIPMFYDESVRQRGYFWAVDRDGKDKKVSLATLSIGIAVISPDRFKHSLNVIEHAKDMWKIAKTKQGNTYVVG